MSSGELLERSLYLFGDATPGSAMLWIRDGGAGAEAVPCSIKNLEGLLRGIPCRIAAPGVECALRPGHNTIEVELERPGGHRVSWSIPDSALRKALRRLSAA